MHFVSTRGGSPPVPFSTAMVQGLAPDGGLYVPERLPQDKHDVAGAEFPVMAARFLSPFLHGDGLAEQLEAVCRAAFSFPIPLVRGREAMFLELFHGPTAAFKDVGARFLAECLSRLDQTRRTVLVATSGDTGGAVAAALWRRPNVDVAVLFPKGGVSPEQQQQLTCWGDNVRAFAVRGTFDDCQRLLKQALVQPGSLGDRVLTTANSINIARLLPQVVYYAAAALHHNRYHGGPPTFVVPAGNVGNATAALWARHMDFPVGHVVMVSNANRTVPDYLSTGSWQPRPSVQTLANAMDGGDPSNMERVFHLYPTVASLRADVSSFFVEDATIEAVIAAGPKRWGRVLDPHTATAVHVVETQQLSAPVIVSTAHPAKFRSIVEPLVREPVEVPEALVKIQERPTQFVEIEPDAEALRRALG
ncbi:MAG: threonine synthase [Planctomycetota bacterium]|jgi:threonine synthase